MLRESYIKSTKNNFLINLNLEVKQFNQKSVFPVSLKQEGDTFILTIDLFFLRKLKTNLKVEIQEEDSFIRIKWYLKRSIFGWFFLLGLFVGNLLCIFSLQFDLGYILFLCATVLFYGFHCYEVLFLKKFITEFLEKLK